MRHSFCSTECICPRPRPWDACGALSEKLWTEWGPWTKWHEDRRIHYEQLCRNLENIHHSHGHWLHCYHLWSAIIITNHYTVVWSNVWQSYVEIEDFPSRHISIASLHSCGTPLVTKHRTIGFTFKTLNLTFNGFWTSCKGEKVQGSVQSWQG